MWFQTKQGVRLCVEGPSVGILLDWTRGLWLWTRCASSVFAISLGPKSCGCQISTCLPKNPLAAEFPKNRFCRVPFFWEKSWTLQFAVFRLLERAGFLLQGLSGNLAVVVAESKTPILTACPAAYASGNKLHFQAAIAAEAIPIGTVCDPTFCFLEFVPTENYTEVERLEPENLSTPGNWRSELFGFPIMPSGSIRSTLGVY